MPKETRVRYVGQKRSGVPFGRVGTLLESNPKESLVLWDPYPNADCQVTHSRCSASELEEVSSIPRCDRPSQAGIYVIEYNRTKALAFVRREEDGSLFVHWSISGTNLNKIDASAIWWGPLDIQ